MKNHVIKTVLIFLTLVFISSCTDTDAAVISAEYYNVNTVKITINGNWSDYMVDSGYICIYGETSDTYYYIEEVLDPPGLRFTDQAYTFQARVTPNFIPGDKVFIFGLSGVLGGTEFTVPQE
jgi:hypothetical protein